MSDMHSVYQMTYKAVEQIAPDLIPRAYPRKFQHGDMWLSPKFLATIALDSIIAANNDFVINGHHDKSLPHVYYTVAKLIECQVPTYFVYPKLLSALRTTKFPKDMTLNDIPWQHESVLFVIPKDAIKPPDEGNCVFLAISKTKSGKPYNILSRLENKSLLVSKDWISTFAYIFGGQSYSWGHHIGDDPVDVGWQDPVFGSMTVDLLDGQIMIGHRDMMSSEILFNHQMISLVLQLLMILDSRKDLISPQEIVSHGKIVKGVKKPDLWKPNLLGKNYEIKTNLSVGTHRSPRFHVRDGHWRDYKVVEGKPWKTNKSIWIEPTFIG